MIPEEFKKKVKDFENMMADFHRTNTNYGGDPGASFISSLRNEFGKKVERKIYNELLEELKLYYHQLDYDEYMLWRKRLHTAFET